MTKFLALFITATCLLFSANASAIMLSSTGGSQGFSVDFNGNVDGTDYPGLNARADMSLSNVANGGLIWALNVSLYNLTNSSVFQSSRISVFGFSVGTNLIGGSVTGVFTQFAMSGITAGAGISTDFCVKGGGGTNNCNGGGGAGVETGGIGSLQLNLNFDKVMDNIVLSNFGIRWQSLESNQHGITDGSGTGGGTVSVFTPQSLLLFALGLVGLAFSRKVVLNRSASI